MRIHRLLAVAALALAVVGCRKDDASAPSGPTAPPAAAKSAAIVRLVTTTSVQDSGLLGDLLPAYEKETGVHVDVVAVGTGAAFKLARDGNADLLLVHDRKGEDEFIASGDGAERRDFAWNTFEIVGPPDDPAGVKGAKDGADALSRIAKAQAPFVSRGDDSGTHRREKKLWETAGGRPQWTGYREAGQGMGAVLTIADETKAYTLTDRGTRLSFAAKLKLAPFLADTKDLRNDYSVVLLSPTKHPHIAPEAKQLADWLVSDATAKRVEAYEVGGESLFHSVRPGR
jgi:tungstate transport system substrate-binding protein